MNHAEIDSLAPGALVLKSPYCSVHISESNFSDHVSMRVAALTDLLLLMSAAHPDNFMISLCARLGGELRAAYEDMPEALLLAKQMAEICLSEQEDEGPGDLLWLCQQMADELRDILSAMMHNSQGAAS